MQALPFLLLTALLLCVSVEAARNRTVVSFKRKLNTCDDRDREITQGTTQVIYAYSTTTPANDGSVGFHGDNAGGAPLRLMSEPVPPTPAPDANSLIMTFDHRDIPFNDSRTGPTTTYFCKTFAVPLHGEGGDDDPVHLIRTEPVITPGLYGRVHHILVYSCNQMPASLLGWEGHCYADTTPQVLLECNGANAISAWAVGGGAFNYPSTVGLPIGGSAVKYLLMEVHYNNPQEQKIVDSSGMNFTFTKTKRKYDAGILTTGINTDARLTIPPQQPAYLYRGWCPSQCTGLFEPMNLIATLLHAHTAGVGISLRHVRDGKELPPILADQHYDFNFQDFESFDTDSTLSDLPVVLPGDTLITECTYNTMARSTTTHFGLTTLDEMCLTFTIFYPASAKVSDARCIYDNVTTSSDPSEIGENYLCSDQAYRNLVYDRSFVPYTAPALNCTYTPPDPSRTKPTLSTEVFNGNKDYAYSQLLDAGAGSNVKLFWKVDNEAAEISFALDVNISSGWIGLGFSPDGGMVGSDVSINFVADDGSAHHTDRFADVHGPPSIDAKQDYYDIVFYTSSITDTDSVKPDDVDEHVALESM